jgi:hypothetical protein
MECQQRTEPRTAIALLGYDPGAYRAQLRLPVASVSFGNAHEKLLAWNQLLGALKHSLQ